MMYSATAYLIASLPPHSPRSGEKYCVQRVCMPTYTLACLKKRQSKCHQIFTGPPTHSVGGQHCVALWRLYSVTLHEMSKRNSPEGSTRRRASSLASG